MDRLGILSAVKQYFTIDELVCDHVYKQWGDRAWQFLDTDYLNCLLVIRKDILKRAMWCNGNKRHQRGLRCNRCDMVKTKSVPYLSAHVLGKAGDFTISGMTAQQAREEIKRNKHILPCNIRMEKGVSWLHFDVLPQYGVTEKVYEFQ